MDVGSEREREVQGDNRFFTSTVGRLCGRLRTQSRSEGCSQEFCLGRVTSESERPVGHPAEMLEGGWPCESRAQKTKLPET